jgi:hypothetical protein
VPRLGQKWPTPARDDRDRPITIDGHALISADQKPPREPFSRNPSSFSLRSPGVSFFHPRERERGDGRRLGASGATASPLAGARGHRKVSAPPSSGFTVAPRSTARRAAHAGSTARTASVHARQESSRDLVKAPASRAR